MDSLVAGHVDLHVVNVGVLVDGDLVEVFGAGVEFGHGELLL